RTIRYISVMLGVFMPGFYVATQLFHLQFIPLRFTLTIASSVKGIPLSPNLEMLFTLFVFELLNEASIRMPKYVGMALSVVGALVLGETAVNAGLISMPTILIMALSGIAVYTVPDQRNTLSILRLFILLLSGAFGIIGLILGALVLAVYLTTLSNYDIPYLAPFAPFVKNDIKDGLLKSPAVITNQRPQSFNNKNKRRLS
ncbi:MAG: spore germination protein, partial [Clostridia bacterium]|nr:spore germination protein [Clostridia bacterium]